MPSKITFFIKVTLLSILRHLNRKWLTKSLFGNTLGNIETKHVRRKSQHCCEEISLMTISWLLLLYNSCLTFSLVKIFVCITLSIHYYSCSTNKSITSDSFIVCLFEGYVRLSCNAPTSNVTWRYEYIVPAYGMEKLLGLGFSTMRDQPVGWINRPLGRESNMPVDIFWSTCCDKKSEPHEDGITLPTSWLTTILHIACPVTKLLDTVFECLGSTIQPSASLVFSLVRDWCTQVLINIM